METQCEVENCMCKKRERGWDGGEEFESTYEIKELYLPVKDEKHTEIISGSTIQTATLTLQGIQAIYNVISMLFPVGGNFIVGLGGLFVPIALLGLVRLPAAPWVSTNYALIHIEISHGPSEKTEHRDISRGDGNNTKTGLMPEVIHLEDVDRAETDKMNLRPESDWYARLYRIWWALSIGALAVLCLMAGIHRFWIQEVLVQQSLYKG